MQTATQQTAMQALIALSKDRRETRMSEGNKPLDTEDDHRERLNAIAHVIETGQPYMVLIEKHRQGN